jgi:hypothetical protein
VLRMSDVVTVNDRQLGHAEGTPRKVVPSFPIQPTSSHFH